MEKEKGKKGKEKGEREKGKKGKGKGRQVILPILPQASEFFLRCQAGDKFPSREDKHCKDLQA